MRALGTDPEQVEFWRRHTWSGIALCLVLPALVLLREAMLDGATRQPVLLWGVAPAAMLLGVLVMAVPVHRVVRHPRGAWFYYAWECVGIVAVTVCVALDGGVPSPYALFYFVILAHAALAYPPRGVALAGASTIVAYVLTAVVGTEVAVAEVVFGAAVLAVATATCALASSGHQRLNRRTAAYARTVQAMAERDGLTGCLVHRAFHARLDEAVRRAGPDAPVSLVLLDVDEFKAVNDTYGHPAGDAVLERIGRVLADLCRSQDVTGRLGGDEFALLLHDADARTADSVARRVQAGLDADGGLRVRVSLGAATAAVPGEGAALRAEADTALYRAKRQGREAVPSVPSVPTVPTVPAVPPVPAATSAASAGVTSGRA